MFHSAESGLRQVEDVRSRERSLLACKWYT